MLGPSQDVEEEEDLEAGRRRARAPSVSPNSPLVQEQLNRLTARLRDEVQGSDHSPMASRRGSLSGERPGSTPGTTAVPSLVGDVPKRLKDLKSLDRVSFLRGSFDKFRSEQNAYITRLLAEGFVSDDELRVHKPAPSLYDQFVGGPGETVRTHISSAVPPSTQPSRRKAGKTSEKESEGSQTSDDSPTAGDVSKPRGSPEVITGTMVLRVFSFLFVSLTRACGGNG